jgi:serine/threonine protein kinase
LSTFVLLQWQSPEQNYKNYVHKSEKSDIFSLGYVLYFLLTGMTPFKGEKGGQVQDLFVQGQRPPISSEIQNSTHPFHIALRTMVIKCLDLDPAARPSSKEVADYLHDALLKAGLTPTPTHLQRSV